MNRKSQFIKNLNKPCFVVGNGSVRMVRPPFQELIGYSKEDVSTMSFQENFNHLLINTNTCNVRALEKKVQYQNEELEAILQSMPNILIVLDKAGKAIKLNDQAQKYGLRYDVMKKVGDAHKKGMFFYENGNEIPYGELHDVRVLKGEKIVQELVIIKVRRNTYYFNVNATPLYDPNGNLIMGVLCAWDVTEKVNYQKIIRNQQKLEMEFELTKSKEQKKIVKIKDEFLATLSHELKTPLTVINCAVQALEVICKDELSDRAKKYIYQIRQNAFREMRLVDNLLEITKSKSDHIKAHKSNIDIEAITRVIVESVRDYAEQKNITMTYSSTFSKKIIGVDEEKFEKIMLNLLANAIKYTPIDKSIDIKISTLEDKICIQVIDTGIGIHKDKMGIIFEPFTQINSSFSRETEGAGIGLSLVKVYAKAIGAEISVESEPGCGSTFTFLISSQKTDVDSQKRDIHGVGVDRLLRSVAIEFSDIFINKKAKMVALS